jgi:outer membrane protein
MTTTTGHFRLKPMVAALLGTALIAVSATGLAQQQPAQAPAVAQAPAPNGRNDLLNIFRQAVDNDATLASARAQQIATQERVPQARSALLPSVGASARADQNTYSSTIPDVNSNFNVFGGGINLVVPLYRPQNLTAFEQARLAITQSEAQFAQSRQDLALRVAIAYFNVLTARDQLIALDAAKRATGEQLQQARREFEVGTKTIIDTNEAQARYDQITAQEQVALGTLLVRRSELQTIIGRDVETISPLRERPNFSPPTPADINAWVRAAEDGSFGVQVARASYEIASREITRARAGHLPTVDVVGGYNINKFNGTQSSDLNPRINSGSVGFQLNIPIYQGGLVQSRVREALALQERSGFDLESARRGASNAAREAYTGVNFGLAQVSALESAEVSARTQLESTQLGYQVGVRIQLDVLNATTQLVQTQRDLKRARYDFLLSALRLKASSGALGEEDVAAVNALLEAPEPVNPPPAPPVNRTPPTAPGASPAPPAGAPPVTTPATPPAAVPRAPTTPRSTAPRSTAPRGTGPRSTGPTKPAATKTSYRTR